MLSKTKNLWRTVTPLSSSSSSSAARIPSGQSKPLFSSPSPSSIEMPMEKGEQIPQSQQETLSSQAEAAEKGERGKKGEGKEWWSGSGFSSTSSSSEGRGDIKERDDVREGRSQARGVTGGEMREEGGRIGKSQRSGMPVNQDCGLDPKKGGQMIQERAYSTKPTGKGTDIPEMSREVTLDRGPGMTGKDSFAFDERGKQVKVDSGIYGSRDFGKDPIPEDATTKGEERVAAAAADSFPLDSKRRPSEKESSSTPGEAEFPSRKPEEGSQHFGKDYSGTPPNDLSSSMKQGLDEAERLKEKAKVSSPQPPKVEAIKQAGKEFLQDQGKLGKEGWDTSGRKEREPPERPGKVWKAERTDEAKASGIKGKEPLPSQSFPIGTILSNIGSSLKEGWKSLMGNNQGTNQRPRYP